jgi:hypothetical protein
MAAIEGVAMHLHYLYVYFRGWLVAYQSLI